MIRVAVHGAAGYIGGELLRLLLGHPGVELVAAVSASAAGRPIQTAHPNLRGLAELRFLAPDRLADLDPCDVLFCAAGHRTTMGLLPTLLDRARVLVDLSGDFRLDDAAAYEQHYGVPHQAPDLLGSFTPGLPETHRDALRAADRIAVPGCLATAAILALGPPAAAGLLADPAVWLDARTGSSGSGGRPGPGSVHAERSGALRVFAPTGHRHIPEIARATGLDVRMTATGVEAVRGVQVLARVRLADGADERALHAAYRARYADEPFVRIVAQRRGLYRLPEPKILAGSNYCDVGFATEPGDGSALLVAALDNLVKGGAGNAVQSMNIRFDLPERQGLEFPGLHPN